MAKMNKIDDGITTDLRANRKSLGLSQEQMAKELGISQAKLSRVESGKAALTKRQRQKLHNRLGRFPGLVLDPIGLFDEMFTFQGRLKPDVAFDPEKYTKIMRGLGIDYTARPTRCNWCLKPHEGVGCDLNDLPEGVQQLWK